MKKYRIRMCDKGFYVQVKNTPISIWNDIGKSCGYRVITSYFDSLSGAENCIESLVSHDESKKEISKKDRAIRKVITRG